MKTVFINGLMLDRSRALIRALCREFTVVGLGCQGLIEDPEITIHDPSEFLGKMDFAGNQEFRSRVASQIKVLGEKLARDVSASPLGPPEGWSLSPQQYSQMVVPRVAHLLQLGQIFRDFHAHQPVHMLISGSDYSSHSRPMVLAARDLGVPTMNIEHGYFFSLMFSKYRPDQGRIPILFSSEYVNLDNPLEVSLISDHLQDFPTISPQLLDLGTPALTVADQAPSKESALESLGLETRRKQVLLLGSWVEARLAGSLISGQLDTIDLFTEIFAALARSDVRQQMDLMIKLHPADCLPQVFPHVSACLTDLALQAGLPAPTIYSARLAEVLAAADVVLTVSWTSVLWDAFLLDKPSVILLPTYLAESYKPGWHLKGNIPLTEGVMRMACDADEAWSFIDQCLQPGYQQELATRCDQVRLKYRLNDKSVEQKSRDITQWIVDFNKQ